MSIIIRESKGLERICNILNFPLGVLVMVLAIICKTDIGFTEIALFVLIFPSWVMSLVYWFKNIYINIYISL